MFWDILSIIAISLCAYFVFTLLLWTIFDMYFDRKMKFFKDLTKIFYDAAENMLEKNKESNNGNC